MVDAMRCDAMRCDATHFITEDELPFGDALSDPF